LPDDILSDNLLRVIMKVLKVIVLLLFVVSLPASSYAALGIYEAYTKALENDYMLKSAKHSFESAKTYNLQGWSGLLPKISGQYRSSDYTTDTYGDYTTSEYSLGLTQPLFDPAAYYKLRQNQHYVRSAELKLTAVESERISSIVNSYMDVLQAIDMVRLSNKELEASDNQLDQAKKLFQAGLVPITNVHDAQANYDSVLYDIVNAENTLNISRTALEIYVGEPVESVVCLAENVDITKQEINDLNHWLETAKENSIDIAYYKSQINEAKYGIDANWASFSPTAALQLNYRNTNSVNEVRSTETEYKSISAVVSVPVFSGGYRFAKLKESREKYYEIVNRSKFINVDTNRLVSESYYNLVGLKSKYSALTRLVESSTLVYESNKKSLAAGLATITDVINAQNDLYNSLFQLTRIRHDFFKNYIMLKHRAGVLGGKDVEILDKYLNSNCEGSL
jgi:outer membrane protein